ncbi:hypothetical protein [Polyangium aurulentum]|uniref:hypothetical protein n=1 Tax=Polyangium aurulentum TaxID=2567896 RepID=UPI0010AE62AB|nr:hypothetical protein [Polyangium aurulentum]UQA55508.1 hypothetical protein E8A73_029695 [Polyangium aurulentum]
MGEVISATAEISRVDEHVGSAFEVAAARGGEIKDAAVSRLEPAVIAIAAAREQREAARKAESVAWAGVLAVDNDSDILIGNTRDEMWNALGRPRQSPHMDAVFPEGIGTYTAGDPLGQPLLMQVLHARILAASAPQWPEPKRNAWAAAIEAKREAYDTAVKAYRPVEAALVVAEAGYRAAVRNGHARLKNFKRDLKSLGLTEAQIHDIIPDASAGKSRGGATGSGDGGTGNGAGSGNSGK